MAQPYKIRRDRLPEVQAAKIAAMAALIGAVIGAAGAGLPTLVSSDRQISAENVRTNAEFLRDRRQAAYAQFIADEEMLRAREREYASAAWSIYTHPPSIDHTELLVTDATNTFLAGKLSSARDAYNKLLVSAANVRIVGSGRAVESMEEVMKRHDDYFMDADPDVDHGNHPPALLDAQVEADAAGNDQGGLLAKLIADIRIDLGTA